ncbi:unnamed protein product [Caenorhabditis sp. 36 PRJEB53466]|nr:unnamed protein product [Caenorhabditis sp. 36 PRJEB53466]
MYTEANSDSESDDASTIRRMSPNSRKDFRRNVSVAVCVSAALTLFVFNLLGALIFWLIEHNFTDEEETENACLKLLKTGTKITTETRKKVEKCLRGSSKIETFGQALYFSWTLYSTVGFGNLYPHTSIGRFTAASYSLLMIPIYIAFKFEFGTFLAHFLLVFAEKTGMAMRRIYEKLRSLPGQMHPETRSLLLLRTHRDHLIFACSLVLCLVSLLGSSALFSFSEGIPFLSSLYFGVITMSLIGIGDIFPSNLSWFALYTLIFLISDVLSNHLFYYCQARIRLCFHFVARRILLLKEKEEVRCQEQRTVSLNHVPVINSQCMPSHVMECEKEELDKDEKLLSSLSTTCRELK